MLTIIVMIMIITIIRVQLEEFRYQSDHYFVYNLAIASCCPMSVSKICLELQGWVWW